MNDELKTGPQRREVPLRISQGFSACSFCKARKIKCDGVGPICGGCTRFGRGSSCSLSKTTSTIGRDYPTYLRNKIQRLQGELQSQRRCDGSTQESPSDPHGLDERQQSSMIDNLIADIGALPILAASYASSFDGPSLSTVVLAAASKSPLSSLATADPSINPQSHLPKQSTALKLAQHYITNIYPRLPFFSVQGFWAQFNHVFSSAPVINFGNGPSPTYDSTNLTPEYTDLNRNVMNEGYYSFFTVLLVLAISTSSLSRSTDSMISDQAQRLFQAALVFRESAILPNTIGGVQSLLFLIQFATLNPSILDAWYLIGVGMRNCVDLGLHQDPSEPVSPSLLETRRRLWWSMYSFDRSMSLGCGRPTEIADAVIDSRLPTFKIESSATEVEVEGYLQRYRVLQLQSLIYDRLNAKASASNNESVVTGLRAKLSSWRESNSPLHSQTLVDSEWLMGKILLLRPCRLISERTEEELTELWESALGFAALYRKLVEANSIFYVQIASEKVYWTGLAMLYSYWKLRGPSTGAEVDENAKPLQIRPVDLWMAVQDVTFILRTLSERWEEGKTLAREFEATSGRVVALMETSITNGDLAASLPNEVVNFCGYASLTSIRAGSSGGQIWGMGAVSADDELQGLISEMITG